MPATKECPSCGAQNDVIFTNCMFCKKSLPVVDLNSISNEDLVLRASEWIGKLGGLAVGDVFWVTLDTPATGINKFFGEANRKSISYAEILGNVEKYLNLLTIRSINNPILKVTVEGLREKYLKYTKTGKKKKTIFWIAFAFVMVMLISVISYMASKESNEEDKEQERLDKIELQINDAISKKDYNQALILTDQLAWHWKLNYTASQKKAEQYDKQRQSLKESIEKMKHESKK